MWPARTLLGASGELCWGDDGAGEYHEGSETNNQNPHAESKHKVANYQNAGQSCVGGGQCSGGFARPRFLSIAAGAVL